MAINNLLQGKQRSKEKHLNYSSAGGDMFSLRSTCDTHYLNAGIAPDHLTAKTVILIAIAVRVWHLWEEHNRPVEQYFLDSL